MKPIKASDLNPVVRNKIIKVMRLQEIQKNAKSTFSDEWENASRILSELFQELADLHAPHQDWIDWSA